MFLEQWSREKLNKNMSHKHYSEKSLQAFQDRVIALATSSGLSEPQLATFKTNLATEFDTFRAECKE